MRRVIELSTSPLILPPRAPALRTLSYGYARAVLRSRAAAAGAAEVSRECGVDEVERSFESALHSSAGDHSPPAAAVRALHLTHHQMAPRARTFECDGRSTRIGSGVSHRTGGFALPTPPKGGLTPLARVLLRRLAALNEGNSFLQAPRAWQKATRRALELLAPPDRADAVAMSRVVNRVSSVTARCTDQTVVLCPPRIFRGDSTAGSCTFLAAHPAHAFDLTPRVSQAILVLMPSVVRGCGARPGTDARAVFYHRALFTAYARAFDLAQWDARRGHLARAALRVGDILESPSPEALDVLEPVTEDARWLFRPPHVRVDALVFADGATAENGAPSHEARLLEQLLLAPPGFYQLPVAASPGGDPDIAADAALGQMISDDTALIEWWQQSGLAADPSWVEPGDDDAATAPAATIAPAEMSAQLRLAQTYITRTAEVVRNTLVVHRNGRRPSPRSHAALMHRLAFLLRVRGGGVDANAIAWWCSRGFRYSCGGTAPGAAVVLHSSRALDAAIRRDVTRAALGGYYPNDAPAHAAGAAEADGEVEGGFYVAPLFMLVRRGGEATAVAQRVLAPSNCRIVYNRAEPRGPLGDRYQWVAVSCSASALYQDPAAVAGPGASNAAWRGLLVQAGMPLALCHMRPASEISDWLRTP